MCVHVCVCSNTLQGQVSPSFCQHFLQGPWPHVAHGFSHQMDLFLSPRNWRLPWGWALQMLSVQIRLDSMTHTHTHCNVLGIYCCGFVGAIYWQYLSPAWPGAFSTISTGTVPLKDYQHSSSPFSPGKRPLLKSMCGFISSAHNNFILILICPDILGSTDGCFPPRNEFIWVLRPAAKAASNKQIRPLELQVLLMCAWICWCKYLKFIMRIQEHGITAADACLLGLLLQKWNYQHLCAH